ncbi:MAG: RHS repeat protein, partial [Candidatus Eremiobacteraeota bacterium]|nr:RHS repeat protein [Candidatus Eremiobacteraeota bacterium]
MFVSSKVWFKYDILQQIDETKRKLSGVDKITGYEYNKNGDLIKVTDARGNSTEFQYDNAGNIKKIEYPDNTSETFQYDGSGNLVEHTDGEGKMTHF